MSERDFDFMPEEEQKFEPIRIEGFSRYEIYPEGRAFDLKLNRSVTLNRMTNFAMYPDDGGPYVMENMRSLIKTLVRQKVPGFTKELPPYRPAEIFLPLGHHDAEADEEKPKQLYLLRKLKGEKVKQLLSNPANQTFKEEYIEADLRLTAFENDNPTFSKWERYTPPMNMAEIEAILSEEASLLEELAIVNQKIREIKKSLEGKLLLLGHYNKNTYGI